MKTCSFNAVYKMFAILAVTTGFSLLLTNCKKKHDDPNPPPAISSFFPLEGAEGTTVTITGSHFSNTNSVVKFGGSVATVTSMSATQLITTVPVGALTGKITVEANGAVASSEGDFTVINSPTITSFEPAAAPIGASVTITGTHFSPTITDNSVSFNGVEGTVTTASTTQLIVTVPDGAVDGQITVMVAGESGTSVTNFTVLFTPVIDSFTPEFHNVADALGNVSITGSHFSSVIANNTVKINGTAAIVSTATATLLTFALPAAATSGKITVEVAGLTGTSGTDFLIGCPDAVPMNVVSSQPTQGPGYWLFNVTYDIKNTGTIPLDINYMYLQSYVSDQATLGGSTLATGGDGRYGFSTPLALIAPGEVVHLSKTGLNSAGTVSDLAAYPYVILQIGHELDGAPTECGLANNTVGTLR